jgi:hypothetical protein
VSFQSTFHVPDDVDPLYWTGGHLHPPGQLDDPSRPIGALCSEIDPGQCDSCPPEDPHANEPRAFHGWSAGSYWRAVKTIPQVSGMVTMTATVIHPPGYRCVPSGQWICDPSDPTMRTSRAVIGLHVRVPDLVELPSDPDLYWRCGDWSTCSSGDNEDVHHPKAFLGTPLMVAKVRELAEKFKEKNHGERLRFTDMSLPWGGLFDFRENWSPTPGHIWHRHGIDIDVVDGAVAGDGRLVALNHRKLNSLACDTGLKRYEYPKTHYRLEGCVAEPDREE